MDSMLVSQEPEISDQADSLDRSSLRVPREDRGFLVRPALTDAAGLVARNINIQRSYAPSFISRREVRQECLQAAVDFTNSLLPNSPGVPFDAAQLTQPIVATGHQPELFHPGVWVKNLTVSEIASRSNSIGLNLIVDNDLVHSTDIRLPAASSAGLKSTRLAFDDPTSIGLPWEEVVVANESQFQNFGQEVTHSLSHWLLETVISDHWPASVELGTHRRLFERLAATRLSLERSVGSQNLELPMSLICQTDGFHRFVFALVSNIAVFVEAHNSALQSFRKRNHIRSQTHPAPALHAANNVFEAPFWVWTTDDPKRCPVFVHVLDNELALCKSANLTDEFARMPLGQDALDEALATLKRLSQTGVKIRTRALTTTMFIRMFLCDLFVHGIGGAKYDEMTDDIIRQFFGIEPLEFLTISYTAWLSFDEPSADSRQDIHQLKQRIRDLRQNPQRYLLGDFTPEIAELIGEKNQLIADQHAARLGTQKQGDKSLGRKRYRRIPDINRRLAVETKPLIEDAQSELQRIERNLVANKLITDREYSFCAFSQERLGEVHEELRRLFG